MKNPNKKNKNRYFHYQKEILNAISEPASFIDDRYRYVFVNGAFNRFYDKQTHEVIGKTVAELWGQENFEEKIKPSMEKCLQGEQVFLLYEGEIPCGKVKALEKNYYPHRKSSGRIDGLICTANDITQRKKAEEDLKKSEAQLKELNATKDKLFSIIGHDLKGPLNNILGFSELIEFGFDSYTEEEIKKYNKIIYQLSQSVSELLENLLTWSRSQRQKIFISPQNIAVHFIVEKCIGLLIQNAIQKEIRLKNSIPPETVVYADEEMITAVIRNLISNALKFTNRGGTVSVLSIPSKDSVIIGVKDTGVGIPQEQIKNLFHPDENNSKLGTEGEKGTGLGLIICKDFVEKNSGELWVESKADKGTIFYFSLPRQKEEVNAPALADGMSEEEFI